MLTGFDTRINVQAIIREDAITQFGDQVRAELPRRTAIDEAFQVGWRLGDRRAPEITALADIVRGF
ncbi:ParA family protein, partial [Pantoea sp. Acro-805]